MIRYDMTCKDCPPGGKRPTPHPGPRCATHWRAVTKERKKTRHEKYVKATYSLDEGIFDGLKAYQGGRCAICQRATGASKELAVDHDHSCCPEPPTCGACTRGVLCATCNQILGHARDDIYFFLRAVDYLLRPPYQRMHDGDAN